MRPYITAPVQLAEECNRLNRLAQAHLIVETRSYTLLMQHGHPA